MPNVECLADWAYPTTVYPVKGFEMWRLVIYSVYILESPQVEEAEDLCHFIPLQKVF